MSGINPMDEQYPNQLLGFDAVTTANQGSIIRSTAPVRLDTNAGAVGATLNSGAGAPAIGGVVGDLYIRTDGTHGAVTCLYQCTVAGAAGAATWAGIA
jgi:hypothetical protein